MFRTRCESVVTTLIIFSPTYYSLVMHKPKQKGRVESIKHNHETIKSFCTNDTNFLGGKPSPGKKPPTTTALLKYSLC